MKVRAKKLGFYGNVRRREGDVFTIEPKMFSERWMEHVEQQAHEPDEAPVATAQSEKKARAKKPVVSSPSDSDVI